MREQMRRLDRLEQRTPRTDGHVWLIQWQGDPVTAKCGDAIIRRDPGETADDFKTRAAGRFNPTDGRAALVWVGIRDAY